MLTKTVAKIRSVTNPGLSYLGILATNCVIRAMPTIDFDGCRPSVPGYAVHPFWQQASNSSGTLESAVASVWNPWTAYPGILDSKSDPPGSSAG